MRNAVIPFLLFISLFLSSCAVTSRFPLSQLEEHEPDPRLTSIWLLKADKEELYFHFSSEKDGKRGLALVSYGVDGRFGFYIFDVITTPIGNHRFMNIRILQIGHYDTKEDVPSYVLAEYEINGNDELFIRMMSPEEVADKIKDGTLQGTIKSRKKTEVYITDTSENLIKFIESSDIDQLFGYPPIEEKQWRGPYQKIIQPFADSPTEQLPSKEPN